MSKAFTFHFFRFVLFLYSIELYEARYNDINKRIVSINLKVLKILNDIKNNFDLYTVLF